MANSNYWNAYIPYSEQYNPLGKIYVNEYKPYQPGDLTDFSKNNYTVNPDPNTNYFSNYNDPYELNSIADVILTTFNPAMERNKFLGLEKIPILNIIPGTILDLAWDKTLKPTLHGNFMATGINTLINLGETLDVVANPVKAKILGGSALDAMGWGKNGRVNYDYNTGSFISDIGAEIISDPLNWATLGIKAVVGAAVEGAVKGAIKTATGEIAETLVKEIGQEGSEQVYKKLAKEAVRSYLSGDIDGMTMRMMNIVQNMTEKGLLNFTRMPVPEEFVAMMDQIVSTSKDTMSTTLLKAAQSIVQPTEKFESALFKSAFISSGISPTWWAMKQGNDWVSQFIKERSVQKLKEYERPDGNISIIDYDNSFNDFVQDLDNIKLSTNLTGAPNMTPEMHQLLVKQGVQADEVQFDQLFRKFNHDPKQLENELLTYLQQNRGMNSLEEYLTHLEKVNLKTNNAFYTEQKMLEEQIEHITVAKEYGAWKEADDSLRKTGATFQAMIGDLRGIFTKQIIDDSGNIVHPTAYSKIDPYTLPLNDFENEVIKHVDAQKSLNFGNFDDFMSFIVRKIDKSEGYSPTSVYEDLMTAYIYFNKTYIEPFFEKWDYRLYYNNPELMPTWFKVQDILSQWQIDIENQIMRYQTKVKKTGKLFDEKGKTWFKFDKKHTAEQLERIIINYEQQYYKLKEMHHRLPEYTSSVYDSIDSFLSKASKAKGIVDKITNVSSAQLIKEYKNIPLNSKDVLKADYKLKEMFDQDIRGWLEQNRDLLRNAQLAPEAFIEKFETFINIDFMTGTMEEYISRYEDLQNYLNSILAQDFKNKTIFKELESNLEVLHPYQITHKNLIVSSDETLIQFKLEQLYTNLILLDNEELNYFVNCINTNSGLGAAINNYVKSGTPEISDIAQKILSAVDKYNNYFKFIEKLYQYPMQDKTRLVFLSTLQKHATQDPKSFYDNLHIILPKIFKDMESYIYSTEMKESLSLDELAKQLEIDIKLATKYGEAEPHTASWDVLRTEAIMQEKLTKEFEDTATNYIVCDIETTGLSHYLGQLLEISFKHYGTEDIPVSLRRGLNPAKDKLAIPKPDVLNTFFPGLSEKEQLAKYFKRFSQTSDHYDEKTILEEFVKRITQLPSNTALIFHNGNEFDIDMLIARMKQHGINTKPFERIEKIDTLDLLKKKAGFEGISKLDKDNITSLLENFASRMSQTSSTKLIDPSNGDLAKAFKDLARLLEDTSKKEAGKFSVFNDPELFEKVYYFKQLGNSIYEQFQFIERSNRIFKTTLYEKSMLSGDDCLKIFIAEVMKVTGLTAQEVTQQYGKYLNPSKLLYALTEGANYVGYKNVINMNKILEYFQFKLGDKINAQLAKGLTSLAKQFEYAYNAIKNPFKLNLVDLDGFSMADEIQRMLTELVNPITLDLSFDKKAAVFFSNIRSDKPDVISNWVLLQYMYKQYNRVNKLTPDLLQQFDKRLINLLEDPTILKSYTKSDSEMSWIEAGTKMRNIDGELVDLSIDNNMVDVKAYREIIDEFQHNTVNSFKNLAQALDQSCVYRPKTQAYAVALQKVQTLLEKYVNKIYGAPSFDHKAQIIKNSQEVTNRLFLGQTYNVFETIAKANVKDIQSFLLINCKGIITADFKDLADMENYKKLFAEIIHRQKELKDNHIGIHLEKTRLYIYLKNTAKVDAQKISKGFLSAEESEIRYTLNDVILSQVHNKPLDLDEAFHVMNDMDLEWSLREAYEAIGNISETNLMGAVGDTTNKAFYKHIHNKLPESVRNDMVNIDTLLKDEFFDGASFNFSNLGTLASRRELQEYMNSSIIDIYRKSAENTARYASARIQYTELYYDKSFSINNGWMNTVSNKDLMQTLKQNPEFVLTTIVQDTSRKHGYKVIQIQPTSEKMIAKARELDAVIMPYQTFSKAYEVINKNITGQSFLNLMHKIVYLYKVGYLLDPGVWLRNFVDSSMKTMIETQTIAGTIQAGTQAEVLLKRHDEVWKDIVKHDKVVQWLQEQDPEMLVESARYTAMDMINKHDEVLNDIMKMDFHGRITDENMEFYFKNMNPKLDKEMFDYVHTYVFDGPSAGLTKELQNYFMDAPKGAWETFVHTSNWLMTPNKRIEQINRLAQYIIQTERGVSHTEAFYKIAKTHFDYAIKSDIERMAEIVFPFYTFTMRNIEYWINAMNNYSWLPILFRDIMTPIWNFDEIDHYELANNRSLQYQILAGNIPLNDKRVTLKVSPSFTDVYNLMTNPVQNISNKVFSPLQTILGTSGSSSGLFGTDTFETNKGKLLNNILLNAPIAGTLMQRWQIGQKYYERTGNPLTAALPGVFGGTLRFDKQPSSKKILTKFPQRTYVKRPKRGRRSFAKRYYPKKTYAKNTYAKKYNIAYSQRPKHAVNMYRNYDVNRNWDSIYKNLYTKTGQSRFKSRLQPVTTRTLKYKIKEFWSYIR